MVPFTWKKTKRVIYRQRTVLYVSRLKMTSFTTWLLLLVLPCLSSAMTVVQTTPSGVCVDHDGVTHPPGSSFRPHPCEHCVCPSKGGRFYCAIADCMMPPCVDPVRKPDQCCSTCPNGPNCYMGNKIIPAGKDVEEAEMVCRCPDHNPGFGFGPSNAQAHCVPNHPAEVTSHMNPK